MNHDKFDETDIQLRLKGSKTVGNYLEVYLESSLKGVTADCEWFLIDPMVKNSTIKVIDEHQQLFENGRYIFPFI